MSLRLLHIVVGVDLPPAPVRNCLLLHQSVQDVASPVTGLGSYVNLGTSDWHVALMSSGVAATETNNIGQGVTIDLSHLDATSYSPSTNIASTQPHRR